MDDMKRAIVDWHFSKDFEKGRIDLFLFIYHLFKHPMVSSGDPKYQNRKRKIWKMF